MALCSVFCNVLKILNTFLAHRILSNAAKTDKIKIAAIITLSQMTDTEVSHDIKQDSVHLAQSDLSSNELLLRNVTLTHILII